MWLWSSLFQSIVFLGGVLNYGLVVGSVILVGWDMPSCVLYFESHVVGQFGKMCTEPFCFMVSHFAN